MSEDAPAKSKPTIFVPPRSSMESLFMNGSGPGFSPGPMTLVSNLFAEQGPFSFSQLLAGAMASPMAKQGFLFNDEVKEGAEVSESDEGKSGSESGVGYKRNRPVNLVVSQPQSQLQIQLDSLSPLFMVPPGLSPSGLLNSPGFLSPLQSPFGMSHSQALAHVTAQAALSPSFQRMQAELQRALSNEPEVVNIETSSPIENLIQQPNPLPSEPDSLLLDSPEISQSDKKTTYNVGDKPASDGYNWRKYGQKQVKASECPRSYYKCTYPNCSVKKKVERSFDGRVSEITYKGNHNHDFPQPTKRGKDNSSLERVVNNNSQGIVEKKSSNEVVCVTTEPVNFFANTQQLVVKHHSDANVTENPAIVLDDADDDEPAPKKRIMEAGMPSIPASTYQISESKIVVQTRSEVDLLDDGYKWRKYGQKVVKGNPHPRSYYRCTFAGCNVRKHVERASADPKAVITTYEGKHDHEIPVGRYSSHGNAIANAQQSKQQKSAKNRFMKEMDFANNEQIPMTLQLKEEQMVV